MKRITSKPVLSVTKRILEYIDLIGQFGLSFIEYIFHKIDEVLLLLKKIADKTINFFRSLKFVTVARLTWSQGRHGKRIRAILVTLLITFVFFSGGIFQSRFTEKSETKQSAFLRGSRSMLLEGAVAATYTSENGLLDEPVNHVVKEGETLDTIGKEYGLSQESIKYANNLTSNYLKVGQQLLIPPVEGTLHTVKKGDTIKSVARLYKVPEQTIVDFNYMDAPYELTVGTKITIPNAQLAQERYYAGSQQYDTQAYGVIPYAGGEKKGSGNFIWPFSGIISQGFHPYHPALDLANNSGDILAADGGVVVRSGWWAGGYGNAIQIDHGNGFVTTYAHMSSLNASTGDKVEKGQKIGVVGTTGRSTGPHLHFTVQKDGQYLNPLSVL